MKNFIFIILCLFLAPANAAIYKWHDKNGNVQYGEFPPEGLGIKIPAKNKLNYNSNILKQTPIATTSFKVNNVTKLVIHTSEKRSKYIRWPSKLIMSGESLWVTFKKTVLEFKFEDESATSYSLRNLPKKQNISTQNFSVLDRNLIFVGTNKASNLKSLHSFNLDNNAYLKLALSNDYWRLFSYQDNYSDGLFVSGQNILNQYQYDKLQNQLKLSRQIQYSNDYHDIITSLSTSLDKIAYIYNGRRNCNIGFYNKNDTKTLSFTKEDIGLPKSAVCSYIQADNEEVWISSHAPRTGTIFSIYNQKNKQWKNITVSTNKILLNNSHIHMDNDNLYYYSCEKLIAINRRTKKSSTFTVQGFMKNSKKHYCIRDFKIHNGYAWLLKFEYVKSGDLTILYKVPLNKLKPTDVTTL